MMRIEFQGREFLLIGDSLEEGGAIATREDYERGLPSYAHLFADGLVRRYQKVIGSVADVKVLETFSEESKPRPQNYTEAMVNMLRHPGWENEQ